MIKKAHYKDIKEVREETLWNAEHIDAGATNVEYAPEDPIVEVQLWEVLVIAK